MIAGLLVRAQIVFGPPEHDEIIRIVEVARAIIWRRCDRHDQTPQTQCPGAKHCVYAVGAAP